MGASATAEVESDVVGRISVVGSIQDAALEFDAVVKVEKKFLQEAVEVHSILNLGLGDIIGADHRDCIPVVL